MRIFFYVDDGAAVLRVNGIELRLSEGEMERLLDELRWAKEAAKPKPSKHWKALVEKYREMEEGR